MSTAISHGTAAREQGRLPSWLNGVNRVIIAVQRLGFVVESMHVLAVPGRHSGVLRSTPVSLLTVDDRRYIVAGLDNADWVLNARVVGRGILHRGRTEEHVPLIGQDGGSDAQLFHDRGRSRADAAGARAGRRGGCASSARGRGEPHRSLVVTRFPVIGERPGAGLSGCASRHAAGATPRAASGRMLSRRTRWRRRRDEKRSPIWMSAACSSPWPR